MKIKFNKQVVFGLTAITLAIAPMAYSQTATTTNVVAETASVMGACGKLFDIDANAAGITAQERAAMIQKNLDFAIINAKHRTPSAVNVLMVNRNPVVTLDGYHIATADGNSAARHNMSQMALAQEWASKIKFCLADAAAVDKYLSMLTGQFPQAIGPREERVAYARAGLYMPVKLLTPINSETSHLGDCVKAQLTSDIPLPTSQSSTQFEAYLPAGSVAIGQLVDASNSYTRNGALGIRFTSLQTPDGETIPINAHIMGGIGTWAYFNSNPQVAEFANLAGLKQTAVAGTALASKGNVCGGWVGYPFGNGIDEPFQKLVLKRRTGVAACAGEGMMLQLAAPTAIAVCTNCAGSNQIAGAPLARPIAIGGAGAL